MASGKFQSVRMDGRYEYSAPADIAPGDIVIRPDGTPAYSDAINTFKAGDLVSPAPLRPFPVGRVPSASATLFNAGASVYFNATTQLATSTNTDVLIGRAAKAKVNGDTTVLVNTDKP